MSSFDPLDLRAHDVSREQTDEQNRLAQQNELDDFKWLMSSKRGRRIIWRWLERTGVYRSSFTGNSETFFREGQRNVGLMLMAQINEVAVEQYAVMLKEHQENVRPDDRRSRNNQ